MAAFDIAMIGQSRFAVAALLLFATQAVAAAGFISGTRVSRVGDIAVVTVSFNCDVQYLGHEPGSGGDQLRIQVEPTSICTGVAPSAAVTRERHRPVSADLAKLLDIEYDGESPYGTLLRLNFAETVGFNVEPFSSARHVVIRVDLGADRQMVASDEQRVSRLVQREPAPATRYVVNLQSSLRAPATADMPALELPAGQQLLVAEAVIEGRTWYRLRIGYFDSPEAATIALAAFQNTYPTAWIDRDGAAGETVVAGTVVAPESVTDGAPAALVSSSPVETAPGDDARLAELMAEGRRLMTAGELSRAVQIYTKVLQQPANHYQPEAQEYLALARERNGQVAHAKAEYERYLATYPDHEGAARVSQRLAALLARPASRGTAPGAAVGQASTARPRPQAWTVRSYLSQYYRRDANQLNDNEEIISQSALYSDFNVDARRRGERFDFSSRLTAGYRKDFLDNSDGDQFRVSYAFADLVDARLGLRGRLGRQSRNTGGVLGRFDGFNLGYQVTDRILVETVVGKPVNSTNDGIDSARTFYGVSTSFGPIVDNLDVGVFFLQQDVESLTDRQVVGAEVRYFGEGGSLWGQVDYDTSFAEIGSFFVQGSLRLPWDLTVTGFYDHRRSPLLSMSAALIGQPVVDFSELQIFYTEDEILQLAIDRTAQSSTTTIGVSRPLTPKVQLNANATRSTLEATPESGGVFASPGSTFTYLSTDLVASSLIREGDVSLLGLRYSDSENSRVYTTYLDTRFPIGSNFRINPRIRVDMREIKSDASTQWIYSPGLRLHYRKDRRLRFEFEAGMQFSSRDTLGLSEDRESWFVNLGYQFLY